MDLEIDVNVGLKTGVIHNISVLVKYCVKSGVDIHCDEDAPLRHASYHNYHDIMVILVSGGANIYIRDCQPAIMCCYNNNPIMAELLLDMGSNIDIYKEDILYDSVRKNYYDMIIFLLKHFQYDVNSIIGAIKIAKSLICCERRIIRLLEIYYFNLV